MNHKDENNKTDNKSTSTKPSDSNGNHKKKKGSEFGAKNVDAQNSGGGYDHPPKGAGPYEEEE